MAEPQPVQTDQGPSSAPPQAAGGAEQPLGFLSQVESQLEKLREMFSQSSQRQTELDARAAEVQQRAADLQARQAELAARAAEFEQQCVAQQAQAKEELESLQASAQARQLSLNQRDEQLLAREQELARARDTLAGAAQAGEQQGAKATAKIQELTAEIEAARQETADALSMAAQAQSRCSQLKAQLEAAEQRAATAPAEAADPRNQRTALRAQRLVRYKQLLQAQAGKIVKAKAGLQKRTQECEQVLAQRGRLSEGFAALEIQKKQLARKAAARGAAALVTYSFVTLAAVAALAWGVAQQIAPATYAARAELVADGKGRELAPDELTSWTATQKQLVEDPQVMAAAAENFARREMPSLGTASAVKQRMSKDLYAQSDKPGTLVLELRGPGAERSGRELETFVSALLAVGNAQRQSRGESAATSVSLQPTRGADPIDSAGLVYAGGLTAGGLVLAGIIGVLLYRVLSRTKQKFEHATGEEAAMV